MFRHLVIALFATLLSGCFLFQKEEESKPLVLKVAVNDVYCSSTPCPSVIDLATRTYPEAGERLKKQQDIELQFDYYITPQLLETAILSENYDAVLSKPWIPMHLNHKAGTNYQRLVDVLDPNSNQWLTGIVVVPVDSPIQSLKELKGKHILLGSGYEENQAALHLFENREIFPGQIETCANCGESIAQMEEGLADAAVISAYALSSDCSTDFANPADYRILAHTEMIPHTSFLLDMNRYNDNTARRIKKALLSLTGTNAPPALEGKGFADPWPWNPPELKNIAPTSN